MFAEVVRRRAGAYCGPDLQEAATRSQGEDLASPREAGCRCGHTRTGRWQGGQDDPRNERLVPPSPGRRRPGDVRRHRGGSSGSRPRDRASVRPRALDPQPLSVRGRSITGSPVAGWGLGSSVRCCSPVSDPRARSFGSTVRYHSRHRDSAGHRSAGEGRLELPSSRPADPKVARTSHGIRSYVLSRVIGCRSVPVAVVLS